MGIPDSDRAAIVLYLDGGLATEDRLVFEQRLATDPELAAAFNSFADDDHLVQVAAAMTLARSERGPVRLPSLWLLAATTLLMVTVWLATQASAPRIRLGVMVNEPTPGENHTAMGLPDADDLRAVLGRRTGSPGADALDSLAVDLLKRVQKHEQERARAALNAISTAVRGRFFQISVRTPYDASVVVLLIDDRGRARSAGGADGALFGVAFPIEHGWTERSGRVLAGEVTLLPGNILRADGERLTYDPGFLVPRSTVSLRVLVAVRRRPLDLTLEADLRRMADEQNAVANTAAEDVEAQGTAVERFRSYLSQAGFDLEETTLYK